MSTILPEGEEIRKAAKWIAEERKYNPENSNLDQLIQKACVQFDLSPKEAEFLYRFVKDKGFT